MTVSATTVKLNCSWWWLAFTMMLFIWVPPVNICMLPFVLGHGWWCQSPLSVWIRMNWSTVEYREDAVTYLPQGHSFLRIEERIFSCSFPDLKPLPTRDLRPGCVCLERGAFESRLCFYLPQLSAGNAWLARGSSHWEISLARAELNSSPGFLVLQ